MFPNDFKGIEYLQILNEYFYAYKIVFAKVDMCQVDKLSSPSSKS